MTAPRRRSGLTVDAILRRCEGKKRYPDELTCNAAGMHYIEIGQIDRLWKYPCKLCRGWHLTKLDNGPRNAIHKLIQTNKPLDSGARDDTNERTDDRAGARVEA